MEPSNNTNSSYARRILAPALAVLAVAGGGIAAWKSNLLTSAPKTTTAIKANAVKAPVAPPPCNTSGTNFSGKDLTNHNFNADPPGSLKNANFQNAKLRGAIFTSQDLTGACFNGADLGPSDKGPADFTQTTLAGTSFIGATLDQTDFTFATINCADFSQTSLIKATFGPLQKIQAGNGCRTKFINSTIDVHVITTDNWGKVDFTDTNFQNLSPDTFSLAGKDITGAILVNANFNGLDFRGANLTNVDLTGGQMINAKMGNTAMNGVKLVKAKMNGVSLNCARFRYNMANNPAGCTAPDSTAPTAIANLTLANLQHADLPNAVLDFALLTGANLAGATMANASLQNATLEATQQPTVAAASFIGTDLTGVKFTNAHINFVSFNNVILAGAIFDGSMTLAGTTFNGSIMPGAIFNGATLQNVSFNSAILQKADFSGSTMTTIPTAGGSGVDFSCAQLGGAIFKDATVQIANFIAAVMPGTADCCSPKQGFSWCGTIALTQQAYGPVTFPLLATNVTLTCPNGDTANCSPAQWKIPNWQTNLCGNGGGTTTVWSKPDCGSDPSQNVIFKDQNLKTCITNTLPGKPANVTIQTASQIRQVTCPGLGISDLTGLEKFTNLIKLDLTANKLVQFSLPLTTIQTLKLGNNQLTTLDLSKLGSLVNLDASSNQLTNIGFSANATPSILDVSNNQLASFDLPIQTSLVYADLSNNKLTNVLDNFQTSLSNLIGLSYLDLSNNLLTTIGSVASLQPNPQGSGSLQSLYVGCNPTFSCAGLGLTTSSSILQQSQCATYNTQNKTWIMLTNPQCPGSQ